MNIVSGITLYTILWWMAFFCVLPIGMQQPTQRVVGEMPGAPKTANIKRKAIITTAIATLLWLVVYGLVRLDIYSFRSE
jgi:predicted secreted protein